MVSFFVPKKEKKKEKDDIKRKKRGKRIVFSRGF
jgi:hypothetical protein